jgi:hypothetical protein
MSQQAALYIEEVLSVDARVLPRRDAISRIDEVAVPLVILERTVPTVKFCHVLDPQLSSLLLKKTIHWVPEVHTSDFDNSLEVGNQRVLPCASLRVDVHKIVGTGISIIATSPSGWQWSLKSNLGDPREFVFLPRLYT